MVIQDKNTGETKRIFWYQWVRYELWFIWNFVALFLGVVFRDYYGQIIWPHIAYQMSATVWLRKDTKLYKVVDWGL